MQLLKAQILCNSIDVKDSLRHSLTGRLADSTIFSVVCGPHGTFFTVLPLEFDNEDIYNGCWS